MTAELAVLSARMAVFAVEKAGSARHEWEDGAVGDPGGRGTGRNPRFVVADGATEAYDSIRWVDQLVTSFVDHDGTAPVRLDESSMAGWFARVQRAWDTARPERFANIFEERKFAEGSFATLLGCELIGMDGAAPAWRAVSLGDTVLFHVRRGTQVRQFPRIEAGAFGLDPAGVHTAPAALPGMMDQIAFDGHGLQSDDHLFLATDALADWIVRVRERDAEDRLWRFLAGIGHPRAFARFVHDRRAAGEMKNDDVTLLRVHVTDLEPVHLMVCH